MGRRIAMLVAIVAAGCVRSQSTQCANGLVCPSGTVCVTRADESNLCVSPDDVAACKLKLEGEPCGTGRRCYAVAEGLVCNDASCGNGFVDLPSPDFPFDERCDDGNTLVGDGCSADCTSTERCGNDVIDIINGETCDDGNLRSHDGCSSTCSGEAPTWVTFSRPVGRFDMSLAYDARRARIVMFGGSTSGPTTRVSLDDFWEWHGYWEPIPSLTRPLARQGAAIAYDIERGQLVMFGGRGFSLYSDMQIWTGGAWVERDIIGPTPRIEAAMAYDAAGRRVVLFGGTTSTGSAADTWVWDGTSWTELVSPLTPPASPAPSMAYDPKTDALLLASAGQTWRLDRSGAGWQYLFDAPSPATGLVYDPTSSDVVAYTIDSSGAQLYRRGSSGWAAIASSTQSNIESGGLVPDVARGRLVLVSQRSVDNFPTVYEWDGASWTLTPGIVTGGPARATALDTKRRRAVVFDTFGETWILDALGDTNLSPPTSPPRRTAALAAYDELRDRVVLFGGFDTQSAWLDDTWEWDGQTWTDVSPSTRPPAVAGRAMAYDRAQGKVVLVGGVQQTKMWQWDGTAWESSDLPTALHGRTGAALAYDPIRERVVWFGGQDPMGVEANDTWLLEPTGWVLQDPPFARPAPRAHASLTWDASRRRLVLYGGRNEDQTIVFGDAWEWDGARWYTVPLPRVQNTNHTAVTAFDGRGIIVLGTSATRLVWHGADGAETCALPFDVDGDTLIGCADPDCWFACAPLCPPEVTRCDPALPPYCGDQQCAPSENGLLCPGDCAAPAARCGNAVCEGEMTTCPGDCPP